MIAVSLRSPSNYSGIKVAAELGADKSGANAV